jgi:PIN domain nuclease of toxin-antitoxin system
LILVLDTHPVVWFLEASSRLSTKAQRAISDPTSQLIIPSIVLAEITYLYNRKRIATPASEIRARLIAADNVVVYPLDEQVVDKLPTALDIHDAIIVATALVYRDVLRHEVAVVTKDEMIAVSGLIEIIW